MGEVGRIVDEGTPLTVADGAFAGVAPMPPFFLLSLVGPAIALHNSETLHGAFPDRFHVSPEPRAGWWRPGRRASTPRTSPWTPRSRRSSRAAGGAGPCWPRPTYARGCWQALADEARLMLDEGVVAAPEDLDLAMITGAGFSFWNGGLTQLLDREGISERVNGQALPLTVRWSRCERSEPRNHSGWFRGSLLHLNQRWDGWLPPARRRTRPGRPRSARRPTRWPCSS